MFWGAAAIVLACFAYIVGDAYLDNKDTVKAPLDALLAIRAEHLTAQTQPLADFRMALPETPAFLAADLSRDVSSEILAAESDT